MKNDEEKKEKIWSKALRVLSKLVLILSCAFYIALLIITLLVRNHFTNDSLIVYIAVGILLLYAYTFAISDKITSWYLSVGSLAYFLFLISFLLKISFFGEVYAHYYKRFELIINQAWIGTALYVAIIVLTWIILIQIYVVIKKRTKTPFVLNTIANLYFLLFFSLFYIDHLKPIGFLIDKSEFLVPFIGFSLAYLHGNFLLHKLIGFKEPTSS